MTQETPLWTSSIGRKGATFYVLNDASHPLTFHIQFPEIGENAELGERIAALIARAPDMAAENERLKGQKAELREMMFNMMNLLVLNSDPLSRKLATDALHLLTRLEATK